MIFQINNVSEKKKNISFYFLNVIFCRKEILRENRSNIFYDDLKNVFSKGTSSQPEITEEALENLYILCVKQAAGEEYKSSIKKFYEAILREKTEHNEKKRLTKWYCMIQMLCSDMHFIKMTCERNNVPVYWNVIGDILGGCTGYLMQEIGQVNPPRLNTRL